MRIFFYKKCLFICWYNNRYDPRYRLGEGYNVEKNQIKASPFYLPLILEKPAEESKEG